MGFCKKFVFVLGYLYEFSHAPRRDEWHHWADWGKYHLSGCHDGDLSSHSIVGEKTWKTYLYSYSRRNRSIYPSRTWDTHSGRYYQNGDHWTYLWEYDYPRTYCFDTNDSLHLSRSRNRSAISLAEKIRSKRGVKTPHRYLLSKRRGESWRMGSWDSESELIEPLWEEAVTHIFVDTIPTKLNDCCHPRINLECDVALGIGPLFSRCPRMTLPVVHTNTRNGFSVLEHAYFYSQCDLRRSLANIFYHIEN